MNRAWLIGFLFLAASGFGQEISASLESRSFHQTALPFSYLEDRKGILDFKSLSTSGVVFSQAEKGKTGFGFTTSVYWIRLDFSPVTTETKYLLELAYPLMDQVEFWLVSDGKTLEHNLTGYRRPFTERPLQNMNFVFPLVLHPDVRSFVYLRLASADRMEVPLRLWQPDEFVQSNNVELIMVGLYFGFIIVIALYNLFMFVVLRFPAFLAYVIYILLVGLFSATQVGLAYQFLWPPNWDNHYVPQNLALIMLSLTIFLTTFFDDSPVLRRFSRVFVGSEVFFSVFFFVSFVLDYALAIQIVVVFALCWATFLVYVGILESLRGSRPARYTLLAFSFPVVGGFVYWLKIVGVIPDNLLSDYALQISSAIEINLLSMGIGARVLQENEKVNAELTKTQEVTILALAYQAELRDRETGDHLARTAKYVSLLVRGLRKNRELVRYLTSDYEADLVRSAPLHDIGKVGVPDAILLKPGKLDPYEFEIMKQHSENGARTLQMAREKLGFRSFLDLAIELILGHHERWDGGGYPMGLKEEQIPLSARIMALADVYDALTQRRVYKPAFSHEVAKNIIVEGRGRHFDPKIVDAFLLEEEHFRTISESQNGG